MRTSLLSSEEGLTEILEVQTTCSLEFIYRNPLCAKSISVFSLPLLNLTLTNSDFFNGDHPVAPIADKRDYFFPRKRKPWSRGWVTFNACGFRGPSSAAAIPWGGPTRRCNTRCARRCTLIGRVRIWPRLPRSCARRSRINSDRSRSGVSMRKKEREREKDKKRDRERERGVLRVYLFRHLCTCLLRRESSRWRIIIGFSVALLSVS